MTHYEIISIIAALIMLIGFIFLGYSTLYPKGYKDHKELWAELNKK